MVGKRTARDPAALGQPDRARGTRVGVCGWPRPGVLTNVPHPAFGVGVCLSIKSELTCPRAFFISSVQCQKSQSLNLE